MNLVYAEVLSVCSEHGARTGKVRVRGALNTVPLDLVPDAQPGDTVVVCDGVALGIVNEESKQSSIIGGSNVSSCTR
jgi:hydrogenase maturation factor